MPALLSAPTAAAASTAAPAPAAASPVAASAEDWIRPEDIGDRADLLLRRTEARLPDAPTIEGVNEIEAGLARLEPDLIAALEHGKQALSARNSLMLIQDTRRELQILTASIAAWKKSLDAEARRVAELLTEIAEAQRRWTATRNRPETAQAGEAMIRRAESSLDFLRRSSEDVKAWRIRVLALSDRLLDRSAAIADMTAKLETATVVEGTSLFVPDNPPLWRRGLLADLPKELEQVPARIAEFQRSTREYLALDLRPLLLQALLTLMLVFLFRVLPEQAAARGRLSHVSMETRRLLARPYAMALLLSLAVTPLLHPTAPQRVTQLISLVVLIPVTRILMVVNERANLPLYLGLFALLLVDRIGIALAALPTLRLLLFMLDLAIGLVLAIDYRRRLAATGGSALLQQLLGVGVFAILLAVTGEVFGWSSLADLVGRGAMSAAVIGVYVYALTVSLEALLSSALSSSTLRRSRFIDHNQELVQRWSALALRFFAALFWLRLVLSAMGLRNLAIEFRDATLAWGVSIGALSLTIGGLLAFATTILVSMLLGRLVRELLEDEIFPRTNLPRGVPHALTTLAGYTIYSLGFLIALAAAGVELGQLAILLGGLGVGIGLGLQDVVKNFAAGLTLLLERRVHVGDAVQIHDKDVFGRVLAIGMRASVVRNWNGTEAVMPNDDLVSGTITNWTLSDGLQRLEVPVEVPGNKDPDAVIALLLEIAQADDRVLENPAPAALMLGFERGMLRFVLHAWIDEEYENTGQRTSALALSVHRALREAGFLTGGGEPS